MNRLIIILIIIGSTLKTYSQCSVNELFPVHHGMSKFEAINTLNLQDNIYEVIDLLNYWSHPDYLEGDSLYHSQVNYKIRTHPCVNSYDNGVHMSFLDHKLYSLTLFISFIPKDYKKCLENYNQILSSLKQEFPYYEKYILNNSETNEQIGEGYSLYKSAKDKNKYNSEEISIEYKIEYEFKWSDNLKTYYKTGNINKYGLQISFVKQ